MKFWCCPQCHAVVYISLALASYCYELLYGRLCNISSNHNIWHIFELDLPEISAKETRNKIQG
uniref:Transmembrane protein n=1 Tax=Rhizophora mucronata TaxID=61149 RepID=A0A2P2IRH0_RHIMU